MVIPFRYSTGNNLMSDFSPYFQPMEHQELVELVNQYTAMIDKGYKNTKTWNQSVTEALFYDAGNPDAIVDNRLGVRLLIYYLTDNNPDHELMKCLVEPFDNGFYKKSDGKSTPLPWYKVTDVQKRLRVEKDVAAILHDFRYYQGPNYGAKMGKLSADCEFFKCSKMLQTRLTVATIDYSGLLAFGWIPWLKHRRKHKQNKKYGSLDYIKTLPDFVNRNR